jgi:hypothetical protein
MVESAAMVVKSASYDSDLPSLLLLHTESDDGVNSW